jgi:hypothetical protein
VLKNTVHFTEPSWRLGLFSKLNAIVNERT